MNQDNACIKKVKVVVCNCLLVFCSVVGTLYMVEFALNWTQPAPFNKRSFYALLNGKVFDSRSKIEVVNELRRNLDGKTVPQVSGFSFNQDQIKRIPTALAGVSAARTVFCNESGDWVTYQSDRYGFNNSDQIWDENPDGVIVGDSFVHGACVPRDQNISSHLNNLGQLRFLNLGVNGAGPYRMLAVLKEYAALLQPKFIIWMFFEGNDLQNVDDEEDHPILRRYLEVGFRQGLPDRQDELDQALAHKIDKALDSSPSNEKKPQEGWEWVKYRIVLESLRRYIGTPTALRGLEARNSPKKEPEGHVLDRRLDSLVKILVEAERVVSEWEGKIVFVYLPQYERYIGNISDLPRPEVLHRVKRIGLPIIDMHENFSNADIPLVNLFPFGMNGHYTSEGYKMVARFIYQELGSTVNVGVPAENSKERL